MANKFYNEFAHPFKNVSSRNGPLQILLPLWSSHCKTTAEATTAADKRQQPYRPRYTCTKQSHDVNTVIASKERPRVDCLTFALVNGRIWTNRWQYRQNITGRAPTLSGPDSEVPLICYRHVHKNNNNDNMLLFVSLTNGIILVLASATISLSWLWPHRTVKMYLLQKVALTHNNKNNNNRSVRQCPSFPNRRPITRWK